MGHAEAAATRLGHALVSLSDPHLGVSHAYALAGASWWHTSTTANLPRQKPTAGCPPWRRDRRHLGISEQRTVERFAVVLGQHDILFLRQDRQRPLAVLPWEAYTTIMQAYQSQRTSGEAENSP